MGSNRFGAGPPAGATRRLPSAPPDLQAELGRALALHQRGDLAQAEQAYRSILKSDSRQFDAAHLLGVIYWQRGDPERGAKQIGRAIQINPNVAGAHNNRGNALFDLGRFQEAVACYDRARALNPNDPQACINRGNALRKLRRFDDALASYSAAIALQPNHATAFLAHANVLMHLKRLDEALASFDRAIALKPDDAEAHSNRGVALRDLKRPDEALVSFERAIALRPDAAGVWSNRGLALQDLKRFDEALSSYDRALSLAPAAAATWNNRGLALSLLKRTDEALASFDRAIALDPGYAEALNNRGSALSELKRFDDALESIERAIAAQGHYAKAFVNRGNVFRHFNRFEEAVASFDRALAIDPGDANAWNDRGLAVSHLQHDTLTSFDPSARPATRHGQSPDDRARQDRDRLREALANYDRALAINPDLVEAHNNRGNALRDLKQQTEALASYDRAIAIKPDYAEAHYNRGLALHDLGRYDEALANYEQAIAARPELHEAFNNRGNALYELQRYVEALASYDRAIALHPDLAEAFSNRGNVLQQLQRYTEALANYDQAIALDPEIVDAHFSRGNILEKAKRHAESFAALDRAVELNPDFPYAEGARLFAKLSMCAWSDFEAESSRLLASARDNLIVPFNILPIASTASDQYLAAWRYAGDQRLTGMEPIWRGERYRHDRIRVAYLSMDFRDHPVSYLLAGLIEHHDRSRIEPIAIAFGPESPSTVRDRLKQAFERFIEPGERIDREVAALMRELEIDIAVDLMSHTGDTRTAVLAHRPAPVSVGYLGYASTSGGDYIDYIMADRIVIPESDRRYFSEQTVYLPDCYMATDCSRPIADRTPSRAELDLPDHGFVFCSFNNPYKFIPDAFTIWMRLLSQVDGSVLWLPDPGQTAMSNLRSEAQARGVAPERLVFAPRVDRNEDHLARLRAADLFLDSWPYNAHTTACDALWAGLPILTCAGATFAGRVAASLLTAVGMPELIAGSPAEYEALALTLARDPDRLGSLRDKLKHNRATTPLFDTARFTRHVEAAYATMWERSQRGEPPAGFAVEPIG